MTELLSRRTIKPQHDLRRLVAIALTLAFGCVVWRQVRPLLVQELARSSLGCEWRAGLIGAAVCAQYPQLPAMDNGWGVQSWRTASSVGVFWRIRPPGPDGPSLGYGVADDTLVLRGTVNTQEVVAIPVPGDWDHDGRVELVTSFDALAGADPRPNANVRSFAVVRLGIDHNEIVAVILVDYSAWARNFPRLRLEWRDADGHGRAELALMRYTRIQPRTVGATFSSETVAVFAWDAPGGILRPRLLPDDGSVLVWTPEDGHPLVVATDEPLDPLLARLVPLPPGFGEQVPATTNSPSASTAPSPAIPAVVGPPVQ
jgi:hypothetical protein